MNRFALLDSDNEDEKPKTASVTVDKKKKADAPAAKSAAPAAANANANAGNAKSAPAAAAPKTNSAEAPKKGDGKGKSDAKPKSDKPKSDKPKSDKPKSDKPKPKPSTADSNASAAPAAAGGEVVGDKTASKGLREGKRNDRGFNHQPRTRYEKRQDEANPQIKPDNRIRGAAHGIDRRRPSKNPDLAEAESVAKEGEKDPAGVEVQIEPVDGEEVVVEEPAAPAEPEDKTISLDEYQRRRDEARAASAILATEKAARAVEGLAGLKIKEDELSQGQIYTGVSKSSKASKSAQRSTGKTVVLDLGFKIDAPAPPAEDRPRDDRRSSGGRGNGNRGNGRSPANGNGNGNQSRPSRGPKVDLADQGAFPSL